MAPLDEESPSRLRQWLSSPAGALVQLALVAAWAVALPNYPLLQPVFMAASAGALVWLLGEALPGVGLKRPRGPAWRWLLQAIAVGAIWQAVTFGVLLPAVLDWLMTVPAAAPAERAGVEAFVAALIIYGLVHPVAEAFVFRGFLLSRLERLVGDAPAGIAVAAAAGAVLFGLANWQQGPAGILAAVATGGVLNLLYFWEDRSLWPTVLAQSVFNVLAIGLALS